MSGIDRPRCKCHGETMYPNNSRGGWRCRIRTRARQNPQALAYYHRADGGYIKRRQRHLAVQKEEILTKLAELQAIEREIYESE